MDNFEHSEGFVERRYSSTLMGVVNTVEWVILALILAFVFRAFHMEAFRIPTGSMAETLRGAHHHLRCEQCGFLYDLGTDGYGSGGPKCSNCGYIVKEEIQRASSNGDRILVLKCIYEFSDPKRWDVAVFKYPVDPTENYIKRMIGLPGETVEIVDGDIFINGEIARKPAKVQREMWMPVFDNDYQPIAARQQELKAESGDGFFWKQPFINETGSRWDVNLFGTTFFTLDGEPGEVHTLVYDSSRLDDFRACYAYNYTSQYRRLPMCSDLQVRFYVHQQSEAGSIGAQLRKYAAFYRGRVDFDGAMVLESDVDGVVTELARKDFEKAKTSRGVLFTFSNVDHQLMLEFGDEELKYDLGRSKDALNELVLSKNQIVKIFGAGEIKLSHVAVNRDTYYTSDDAIRPRADKPFVLGEDEFFVCGDNSPASFDSRKWSSKGKGNRSADGDVNYRKGIVPRDYLMGKAFFLYWGDAYKPFGNALPLIPNFSQMKLIYGGSGDELNIKN